MPLIKNKIYASFKKGNIIQTLQRKEFIELLNKVEHKDNLEAKALVVLLWATAARPVEVLNLKRENIFPERKMLYFKTPKAKGSTERMIALPLEDSLTQIIVKHISRLWQWQYVFPSFRSTSIRKSSTVVRKKKVVGVGGTNVFERVRVKYNKPYPELSDKLRYWFNKWEFPFPPYFFRHNRMSIAAEFLSLRDLMVLKGAKKEDSVYCYLHQTKKQARKMSQALTV